MGLDIIMKIKMREDDGIVTVITGKLVENKAGAICIDQSVPIQRRVEPCKSKELTPQE